MRSAWLCQTKSKLPIHTDISTEAESLINVRTTLLTYCWMIGLWLCCNTYPKLTSWITGDCRVRDIITIVVDTIVFIQLHHHLSSPSEHTSNFGACYLAQLHSCHEIFYAEPWAIRVLRSDTRDKLYNKSKKKWTKKNALGQIQSLATI